MPDKICGRKLTFIVVKFGNVSSLALNLAREIETKVHALLPDTERCAAIPFHVGWRGLLPQHDATKKDHFFGFTQ